MPAEDRRLRGRIRTFKPELFDDEELWDLGASTGLPVFQLFLGLWSFADREGRFEWRPRALKKHILPYWDGDVSAVLEALASKLFIVRYTVNGRDYGYVRTLTQHQSFNKREPESTLPPPEKHGTCTHMHASAEDDAEHVHDTDAHLWNGTEGNGNGTEGNGNARSKRVALPAPDNLTEPVTYTFIPDGWHVSDEFYSEALIAGVTRALLDEDVTYWRGRKLGGEWRSIEQFFRAHFPRLAKRRETEAFKAPKHGSAQPNAGKTGWE